MTTLHRPTLYDAYLIWRWRNHPTTWPMMGQRRKIGFFEHFRWFHRVNRNPSRVHLFVVKDDRGKSIGMGRLDVIRQWPSIYGVGILVAPDARGAGVGTAIIKALARTTGCAKLVATIRPENVGSIRMFKGAGFRMVSKSPFEFAWMERP